MKKWVSVWFVLLILVGCVGCNDATEKGASEQQTTTTTNSTTVAVQEQNVLTAAKIKATFKKKVATASISNESTEKNGNETKHSFRYFKQEGYCIIYEKNGQVTAVSSMASSESFMDVQDLSERLATTRVVACLPLYGFHDDPESLMEKFSDSNYLVKETDTTLSFFFKEGDWEYHCEVEFVSNAATVAVIAQYTGKIQTTEEKTTVTQVGAKTTFSHHDNQKPVTTKNKSTATTTRGTNSTTVVEEKNTTLTKATTTQVVSQETEDRPCAKGHSWKENTKVVHHEEKGHYEERGVEKKQIKYKCAVCFSKCDTLNDYYAHFDSSCGSGFNAAIFRERYETVEEWVTEYQSVWVVDQKAYDETVVINKTCTVCGVTQ